MEKSQVAHLAGYHPRNEEEKRLLENELKQKYWKKFGPYLSERQWATVREDYSENGDAWNYFPHEHARSRTYRWGEDGIAGISDNHQHLCFALAFWNGEDPILKERLFGLTNDEGNHGEDVKELYYYLDNTPTHSYMKYLYKYPHSKFTYDKLVEENRKRGLHDKEYEILDTGIFDENKYFDIFVEYAKNANDPEDIYILITAHNRCAKEAKMLSILPTLWYRNTWIWGKSSRVDPSLKVVVDEKPCLKQINDFCIESSHLLLGKNYLYLSTANLKETLFTDNESNFQKLYGVKNYSKYCKDAFHDYVINEKIDAVNPEKTGTKCAVLYSALVSPSGRFEVMLRLNKTPGFTYEEAFKNFKNVFQTRKKEADIFYSTVAPNEMPIELRNLQRQAFAGLLWSKQFYNYAIQEWLDGDPNFPPPPPKRSFTATNKEWKHVYMEEVLSMPDKWEYPFFAAWDSAFHAITFALIDPDFAKRQLIILTREWYMHPNGQIPAYEWKFDDVNPPVHAWAAYRVFKIEAKTFGRRDYLFLERVFQKLLLNFTWWTNRKDKEGFGLFEGGFLGLDNIGVFNRSEPLPTGGRLIQADGTSWMAMFCLNMLQIAMELALHDREAYEDICSKFFEHFLYISDAMTYEDPSGKPITLWDDIDGFYYDLLVLNNGNSNIHLKYKSMVGLVPLFACIVLEPEKLDKLPEFKRRTEWFLATRYDLTSRNIACMTVQGVNERRLLAIVNKERLSRIVETLVDENQFWSKFGIRSLSKHHEQHPYSYYVNGHAYVVDYVSGESKSRVFGGNSNWRGGDALKFECPKGSGNMLTLEQIAQMLTENLCQIFSPFKNLFNDKPTIKTNERILNGDYHNVLDKSKYFKDYILFYEYFDAETGRGCGASHQTGWTALIAKLIQQHTMPWSKQKQ